MDVRSLTILIATRNRLPLLKQCVESVRTLVVPPDLDLTLRVVDNGSTDGTWQFIEQLTIPGISVEPVHEPVAGKSRALNHGLQNVASDIVAFTDDDMLLDPSWASAIADHFAHCSCSGLQGAIRLTFPGGRPEWFTERCEGLFGANSHLSADYRPQGLAGGNMAVRTATIGRLGPFREDLGPHGKKFASAEDVEWSGRILNLGESLCYCPDVTNYHVLPRDRMNRRDVWLRQFEFVKREVQTVSAVRSRYRSNVEIRRLLTSLLYRKRDFQGFDYGLELAQRCGRIAGMLSAPVEPDR